MGFTVRNVDTSPASELHVRLGRTAWPPNGSDPGLFRVTPEDLRLGPGQQADVSVTFTPNATGHQAAVLPIVACADNQRTCLRGARLGQLCTQDADCGAAAGEAAGACGGWRVERLLAHGFGGTAPGTGPTLAAEPLFHLTFDVPPGTLPLRGILPSGLRFEADTRVRSCGGQFTFDICLEDRDCLGGGGCPMSGVCTRGENAGQACTTSAQCSGAACTAQVSIDPSDMCGDGTGALYVLHEDSATDPATFDSRGTIGRFQFDLTTGQRTNADLVYHPAEESTQLACDGRSTGGRVYVPEYHELETPPTGCERDEREALASISKTTGGMVVPPGFGDIDRAAGYPTCEIFDEVQDIRVTRDGLAVFVGLPLTGLTRILPQPPVVVVPDYFDTFELHPDGSVVFVLPETRGTTGFLKVYKVSVAQAQQGALRVNELAPCVTVPVPNAGGRTGIGEFAVGRARADVNDATIVVSFYTSPLSDRLLPRGTVAISSPAGSNTCSVAALLNLEVLSRDLMTF
jgi:hypothetical protein